MRNQEAIMNEKALELLYKNVKAEAEAIEEYTELLALLDGSAKAAVEEIVSDEKQHLLKLLTIATDTDKIKIAKDDMDEILAMLKLHTAK